MDHWLDYLPPMFALQEPRAFPLSKQRLNRVGGGSRPRGPERATQQPTYSPSDFRGRERARAARGWGVGGGPWTRERGSESHRQQTSQLLGLRGGQEDRGLRGTEEDARMWGHGMERGLGAEGVLQGTPGGRVPQPDTQLSQEVAPPFLEAGPSLALLTSCSTCHSNGSPAPGHQSSCPPFKSHPRCGCELRPPPWAWVVC